jgi:hypothetical protein
MDERDDEDDVTIWAGRLRAWPAPDAPSSVGAPAEGDAAGAAHAVPVSDPDAELEDATALVRREPAGPRRRGGPARGRPDPVPDRDPGLPPAAPHPVPDREQTTPVADRRPPAPAPTRPPAAREAGPDGRRAARVPDAGSREIYRPRSTAPAIVERRPAEPRSAQHPADPGAAASADGSRHRRRRTWSIVTVGAVLVVVAAAIWVLVLALG